MSVLPVILAALLWHPAADSSPRPDPSASPRARRGGTLRFSGSQPPKSFNAYVDNNSYTAMLFSLMYETLLESDPETGEPVPALARRWATSEDGREFVFELDPRAKWSDGRPVTAADVKWTFDAVTDPRSDTGPWKPTLAFFESPEVVDERTVRFVKKGDGPKDWRDVLNCSSFWILPRHAFEGRDFNKLDFVGAVSGGAYFISRAAEQVETELSRHGRWWRQDLPQCRGLCNFDRIVVRYFAENENAFEAFRKRRIDVFPVYSARIYADGTRTDEFARNLVLKRRVRNHAPIGFQGFAMNMRRPPFDRLEVRQAMAKLVDRETMNRTMMNGAYFLLSSYYQDLYDAAHPCTNAVWRYDVEGAKELLAKAGLGGGFSLRARGVRGEDGDRAQGLRRVDARHGRVQLRHDLGVVGRRGGEVPRALVVVRRGRAPRLQQHHRLQRSRGGPPDRRGEGDGVGGGPPRRLPRDRRARRGGGSVRPPVADRLHAHPLLEQVRHAAHGAFAARTRGLGALALVVRRR